MSTTTAVERLRKLEAEAKTLRSQAKKEALAAVQSALSELNALGFSYQLKEGTSPLPVRKQARAKRKAGIKRKRNPNAVCKVCGEKGHDARRHRWDKKKKK